MRRTVAAVLLFCFALLGCRDVTPAEVAGTWVMNEGSRDVLPAGLKDASPQIVLKADGSFVASGLPAFLAFPGHRDERLESGRGKWRLVREEWSQQVQLDFYEIADWPHNELPFGAQLNVSGGWSAPSLYYFLGDPDAGKRVDLERR